MLNYSEPMTFILEKTLPSGVRLYLLKTSKDLRSGEDAEVIAMFTRRSDAVISMEALTAAALPARPVGRPAKSVRSLTDGREWPSYRECAQALGVTPSMISQHLRGLVRNVKGHVLWKPEWDGTPEWRWRK